MDLSLRGVFSFWRGDGCVGKGIGNETLGVVFMGSE